MKGLSQVSRLAEYGVHLAMCGDLRAAAQLQSQLNGWWQCAVELNELELSEAAYRGAEIIRAARQYALGDSLPVTDNTRILMWGYAS